MATHLSHNPLVEVLGLRLGDCGLQRSIDEALDGRNLVLLGQHRNIVLEWVRDPEALVTDVRDALVVEPVILLGQSLVEAVIKVFVVGEDNVTADIVQLSFALLAWVLFSNQPENLLTYEALGSDICSRETTSLFARVHNQPRGAILDVIVVSLRHWKKGRR